MFYIHASKKNKKLVDLNLWLKFYIEYKMHVFIAAEK